MPGNVRGEMAREVGEQVKRPVCVCDDLLTDVEHQPRRSIDDPRQIEQRDNPLRDQPAQQRAPVSPPAPQCIESQADGQEDGVVLRVERERGQENVGCIGAQVLRLHPHFVRIPLRMTGA